MDRTRRCSAATPSSSACRAVATVWRGAAHGHDAARKLGRDGEASHPHHVHTEVARTGREPVAPESPARMSLMRSRAASCASGAAAPPAATRAAATASARSMASARTPAKRDERNAHAHSESTQRRWCCRGRSLTVVPKGEGVARRVGGHHLVRHHLGQEHGQTPRLRGEAMRRGVRGTPTQPLRPAAVTCCRPPPSSCEWWRTWGYTSTGSAPGGKRRSWPPRLVRLQEQATRPTRLQAHLWRKSSPAPGPAGPHCSNNRHQLGLR